MNQLATTLETAINSPDCSIFLGGIIGFILSVRFIIILVFSYFIIKVVNNLALEPLLKKLKELIYKKKVEK